MGREDRQQLIIHGTETAADSKADAYWMLCEKRAKGRPLQYILGEWPFMDFTLRVGDGVLVPREETELLVYTVAEHIKSAGLARADLQGADLCGGSGAVALGLSSLLPRLKLFCAEFYEGGMPRPAGCSVSGGSVARFETRPGSVKSPIRSGI